MGGLGARAGPKVMGSDATETDVGCGRKQHCACLRYRRQNPDTTAIALFIQKIENLRQRVVAAFDSLWHSFKVQLQGKKS